MAYRSWMLSPTSLTLTLTFLLLHGPISMQVEGSILRRMPIFYGKRDLSSSQPRVNVQARGGVLRRMPVFYGKRGQASSLNLFSSIWDQRLDGENQNNADSGYPDTNELLRDSFNSARTRTGSSNRHPEKSRELLDGDGGVLDVTGSSHRSAVLSALSPKPVNYVYRDVSKNRFPEAALLALDGEGEPFTTEGDLSSPW